jgi:hypothetical protein
VSSQYDAVAQRSLAAIARKGADVSFATVAGTPVYDPITDTWSGGSAATATGKAVQTTNDLQQLVALSLVTETTVTLLVAARGLTITPDRGEHFTWAGVDYTIKQVEKIAPDGTPILYRVVGAV